MVTPSLDILVLRPATKQCSFLRPPHSLDNKK